MGCWKFKTLPFISFCNSHCMPWVYASMYKHCVGHLNCTFFKCKIMAVHLLIPILPHIYIVAAIGWIDKWPEEKYFYIIKCSHKTKRGGYTYTQISLSLDTNYIIVHLYVCSTIICVCVFDPMIDQFQVKLRTKYVRAHILKKPENRIFKIK